MTPKKNVLAAAMVTALVVGVSACGSDSGSSFGDKSPAEIAESAREAMLTLTSLELEMDVEDEAENMRMSLTLAGEGDCQGSMAVDEAETEFIISDGTGYLKPNAAFFESEGADPEMMEEALGGRWLAAPEEQSGLGDFCNVDSMLADLADGDATDGDWKSIDNDKIGGIDTVGLQVTNDDGTTDVYVADDADNPYIVKMIRSGDEEGHMTFSGFNDSFDIQAPSADESVSMEELSGL